MTQRQVYNNKFIGFLFFFFFFWLVGLHLDEFFTFVFKNFHLYCFFISGGYLRLRRRRTLVGFESSQEDDTP